MRTVQACTSWVSCQTANPYGPGYAGSTPMISKASSTNCSRHLGTPPEEARPTPGQLGIAFVTRVVVAYVLAVFAVWAGARGVGAGMEIGFLAWLGFVVPLAIGQAAFERRPWQVVAVALPESLIGLVLMGAIVGAWS